jgi:streptogramin lyase
MLSVLFATAARAQIFVSSSDGIGEYSTSGSAINASLIPGVTANYITLDNSGDIFFTSTSGGAISEYTTSGSVVASSLVFGLTSPQGLALDGSGNIFVVNSGDGAIGEYSTAGSPVNPSIISGLTGATAIALDGKGNLFVAEHHFGTGFIAEYTTGGQLENGSLISGLDVPNALQCVNNDLYVVDSADYTVTEYDTSGNVVQPIAGPSQLGLPEDVAVEPSGNVLVTDFNDNGVHQFDHSGDPVGGNPFIGDLPDVEAVAVETPEPSPALLTLLGGVVLGFFRFRRK